MLQAIPRITSDFHSLPDVGWYGSAYLLAKCVRLLPYNYAQLCRTEQEKQLLTAATDRQTLHILQLQSSLHEKIVVTWS